MIQLLASRGRVCLERRSIPDVQTCDLIMAAPHELTARPHGSPTAASNSGNSSEVEPSLLDAIVQQTAAALDEQSLAQTCDLPRLRDIAQRHGSDALTLDPILIELIAAILETHLPLLARSSTLRAKVARSVSQTLFDNPVCRGRLELLWSQLLDNVS